MPDSITLLLSRVSCGDRMAFDRLVPLVYHELHRIAEGYLRHEPTNHTLQPTALIHEAFLRLVDYNGTDYQSRTHFYAVAARVMRQILADHARARHAAKRGGIGKFSLDENMAFTPEHDRVVMALDDALNALAKHDALRASIVEMRFFGGMTLEDIAACLAMPVHTVRRQLRTAQIWLRREIES